MSPEVSIKPPAPLTPLPRASKLAPLFGPTKGVEPKLVEDVEREEGWSLGVG